MSTLRPEDLGLHATGRVSVGGVLIPKRKKPTGYGFMPSDPDDRFYIVEPVPDRNGRRPESAAYSRFNECKLPQIVSSIPCVLGGHTREDVEELSRGYYRHDTKTLGPAHEEYMAPPHKGAFCSTVQAEQTGPVPLARRWRGEERGYEEIPCPGDQCIFTTAQKGKRPPCIKMARLWFFPDWERLAEKIRTDRDPKARDFADSIRSLPSAPLKLTTGGQFAPSIRNFNEFMAGIENQAKALELWPCSLVGFRFWLSVSTKTGDGTRYTVYNFTMADAVHTTLLEQKRWRQQIAEGKQYILLNPAAGELTDDATGADHVLITDLPPIEARTATRPANVAVLAKPSTDADPSSSAPAPEAIHDASLLMLEQLLEKSKLDEVGLCTAVGHTGKLKDLPVTAFAKARKLLEC